MNDVNQTYYHLVSHFLCNIFDIICDLLLNRHTATWNPVVKSFRDAYMKVYQLYEIAHLQFCILRQKKMYIFKSGY